MSDKTAIEWTDATWNPIRGCSRVSEGCRHCYAEGVAARFSGPDLPYEGLAKRVKTPAGSDARWTGVIARAPHDVLLQPLKWKRPRKIFVNSMSDLFHEGVPDEWLHEIFAVMALCPQHTFQILTKRPERMRTYLAAMQDAYHGNVDNYMSRWAEPAVALTMDADAASVIEDCGWPLPNVWLGVSVEDQVTADTRIPYLLDTPAAIRFISAEPLLGAMDIRKFMWPVHGCWRGPYNSYKEAKAAGGECGLKRQALVLSSNRYLDWVIVGGESGPKARPMHPDWAKALRDQCAAAEVPFLFKQWGAYQPNEARAGVFLESDLGSLMKHTDRDTYWAIPPTMPKSEQGYIGTISVMERVGKKTAGRFLDGIEHNAFPKVAE